MSTSKITFTQTPEPTSVSIVDIDGEGVRHNLTLRVNRILKDSQPIDFNNAHKTLQGTWEIALFIESKEGTVSPLMLDEEMYVRLALVLQEYGKMSESWENFAFQCSHFASLVAGILPTSQKSDWDFTFLSNYQFLVEPPEVEYSLAPWDIIFLWRVEKRWLVERWLIPSTAEEVNQNFKVEKRPYHFAMYLWDGLYISKFSEHNVGVSDFAALRDLYSCNDVFLVKPKKQKVSIDEVKKRFSETLLKIV